jgi:hypothetical protein
MYARRNEGKYWSSISNTRHGTVAITAVRDLTAPGFDSETPDHKPVLPVSKGSNMLTYKVS